MNLKRSYTRLTAALLVIVALPFFAMTLAKYQLAANETGSAFEANVSYCETPNCAAANRKTRISYNLSWALASSGKSSTSGGSGGSTATQSTGGSNNSLQLPGLTRLAGTIPSNVSEFLPFVLSKLLPGAAELPDNFVNALVTIELFGIAFALYEAVHIVKHIRNSRRYKHYHVS